MIPQTVTQDVNAQAPHDAADVLQWLNTHSVTLTKGLPLRLLQQKWRQLRRSDERLSHALEVLIGSDWVVMTPSLDPPHLRISPNGYRRLTDGEVPGETTAVIPPLEALDLAAVDAAPALNIPTRRYASEIGLRNQILSIYRDLKLKADSRLIAVTLSRYWQESGQRSGDLRAGLDVLLRDGYVRQRLDGMDTYWVLTEAGERYAYLPSAAEALIELAPPLGRLRRPLDEERLQLAVLEAFSGVAADGDLRPSYAAMLALWQLNGGDANSLLHGLDLLLKAGALVLAEPGEPVFQLTSTGVARSAPLAHQRRMLESLLRNG
jgi:hypothetical protein